jgi:large conductance mechanosensitive channel
VILQFVIIAACVFLVIRGINKVKAKVEERKEPVLEAPAQKPEDILLLEEIRDLLKKQ